MTETQRAALEVLACDTWVEARTVAEELGSALSGVRAMLGRMVDAGYLRRRGSRFRLTARGRAALRAPWFAVRRRGLRATHDPAGPRYGPLFRVVRTMQCWLASVGYRGPGHLGCGPGVQGGHTAHHLGRLDEHGLIPGCGAAHDLYAGLGGAGTVRAFRAWLEEHGYALEDVGMAYVERARALVADADPMDAELVV